MISNAALFGLTRAQVAEEARIEAGRGHGLNTSKAAVRSDEEAADYTAEIMSLDWKECGLCGAHFVGAPDESECPRCVMQEMK
jgi:rubrerythrin